MPIYCNKITGNLVRSKLRVEPQHVHILPMDTECTVEGVRVTLLDANHCPGAAMLLFLLPDGQTVLHTGDFRADPSMERCPELLGCRVQTLYLDTTYCSPEYTFPTQQEVITFAVNTAFEHVALNPRTLVVCGTYSIGKEKVFLAIADVLGSKVSLSRDKFGIMCCLESERIRQLITTDWNAAQIHILPMMQVNFKNLQAHLSKFSAKYDQVLAFKPTGWTFSNQTEAVEDIQPVIRGNVSIYGIPYSEHSSYLEMKRFVQWLRPLKIIPTVNVGSRDSRQAMDSLFGEWRAENSDRLASATGGGN
ncbi:hypothetical protein AAFF_G00168920 [Aldrovandia affinis]|uniref:DNA repair metallo-beta-lactamase domain-containing protein n=1 Tax=Aldrovandia affinis TaxID=143900 RepID=A0AAD7RLL7_9TELE|nr:hypothetical protein AAFF_G00168920 [Aldrovandia affinis]